MKLISINVWGGIRTEDFQKFLENHRDVDIFCFQEVYHEAHKKDSFWTHKGPNFNFLNDLKKWLPTYDCYYRPHLGDWWGLAIFIKKGLPVIDEGEHFVHKFKGHNMPMEVLGHTAKNIQFMTTTIVDAKGQTKRVSILNFHGLWNGNGKGDTEDRLNQSRKMIDFIKALKNDFVLCGDFNLNPDTESFRMIGRELGCRDLIKENGVTSTRTSLYPKENRFADYAFVSKGINVLDFKVLPDEISDHAPLFLEFE